MGSVRWFAGSIMWLKYADLCLWYSNRKKFHSKYQRKWLVYPMNEFVHWIQKFELETWMTCTSMQIHCPKKGSLYTHTTKRVTKSIWKQLGSNSSRTQNTSEDWQNSTQNFQRLFFPSLQVRFEHLNPQLFLQRCHELSTLSLILSINHKLPNPNALWVGFLLMQKKESYNNSQAASTS